MPQVWDVSTASEGGGSATEYPINIEVQTDGQTSFTLQKSGMIIKNGVLRLDNGQAILQSKGHFSVSGTTLTLNIGYDLKAGEFISGEGY